MNQLDCYSDKSNPPLDEKQAAQTLGIAVQTLRNWRHLHKGPPYYKIEGRTVRYSFPDLMEYLEKGRISPREVA